VLVAATSARADGTDPEAPPAASSPAAPFGFRALEIYKLDSEAVGLCAGDFNQDGLQDLVLADNSDGTLRFFLQEKPGTTGSGADAIGASAGPTAGTSASTGSNEVLNDVASDRRFRVEKFYTEKHVSSVQAADFNGDGRADVAFYADPPELEVLYQSSRWGERREKLPIRDGDDGAGALLARDLDADGRADIVLLGKQKVYVISQLPSGELAPPLVLHHAAEEVASIDAGDLDHDGRLDLIYITPSAPEPVGVRLHKLSGFGPLMTVKMPALQAWTVAPFRFPQTEEPLTALFTIGQSPRRLKVLRWQEAEARSGLSLPRQVALRPESEDGKRQRLLADVDGDGRTDLVVSYAETARLDVHFQNADGSLSRRATYPTLAGVNALAAADLDGDGKDEVVVSSDKEKAIGVSAWRGGRLQVPEIWPLASEPALVSAARLSRRPSATGGESARVFAVLRDKDSSTHWLHLLRLEPGGKVHAEAQIDLKIRSATPNQLRVLDLNGDALSDVLVSVPFEAPYLFQQARSETAGESDAKPDGAGLSFTEVSRQPGFNVGLLAGLAPSALTVVRGRRPAAGDGSASEPDQLLVAAANYARLLRLDPSGGLKVADQYSARGAQSKLVGAAMLDLDGPTDGGGAGDTSGDEIVLLDASTNTIEILRRRSAAEAYQNTQQVEIPKLDLLSVHTLDMNGDQRQDLVLLGENAVSILYQGARDSTFVEAVSFAVEKDKQLGLPQDVAAGDVNGDGEPDLILNTAPRYNFIFLAPASQTQGGLELTPKLTFPIFEEKSYMRQNSRLGPREMLVRDVDGDGLNDLLLLVHDRLLVYLQDRCP
jgi:hypothetical protein